MKHELVFNGKDGKYNFHNKEVVNINSIVGKDQKKIPMEKDLFFSMKGDVLMYGDKEVWMVFVKKGHKYLSMPSHIFIPCYSNDRKKKIKMILEN